MAESFDMRRVNFTESPREKNSFTPFAKERNPRNTETGQTSPLSMSRRNADRVKPKTKLPFKDLTVNALPKNFDLKAMETKRQKDCKRC
jgi:hypothetical protein